MCLYSELLSDFFFIEIIFLKFCTFTAQKRIHVFIRFPSGKTVGISNFTQFSTILELKEQIEEKEGIPPDKQLLMHDGKELTNHRATFGECGINDDALVNFSVKEGN